MVAPIFTAGHAVGGPGVPAGAANATPVIDTKMVNTADIPRKVLYFSVDSWKIDTYSL